MILSTPTTIAEMIAMATDAERTRDRKPLPTSDTEHKLRRFVKPDVLRAAAAGGWTLLFVSGPRECGVMMRGMAQVVIAVGKCGGLDLWSLTASGGSTRTCVCAGLQHELLVAMGEAQRCAEAHRYAQPVAASDCGCGSPP